MATAKELPYVLLPKDKDHWKAETFGETLSSSVPGPEEMAAQVQPDKVGTLQEIKAQKFAELVKEKGIVAAAREVGEREWRIYASQEEVRNAVMRTIRNNYLPPDARKMLVRAGFNQLAVEGLTSTDPTAKKVALDALKSIAADTEVGIMQPAAVQVSIDMGALKNVLESSALPEVEFDGETIDVNAEN